ncbi:MAG: substrate-binding protein [Deltaproteobacteria bacterium]|nr:substrate-binding protein [Deltaproteobacteria bacterium]
MGRLLRQGHACTRLVCRGAVLGLLLFGLSVPRAVQAAQSPIKVGVVIALSGFIAADGQGSLGAIKLWQKEVNESGGLLGRRIVLIVEDSASDPKTANEKMKRVMAKHPDVCIGPILSAERTATYRTVVDAGVPFLYFTFYEGGAYHPLMFITGEVPEQQTEKYVPWLVQNYGPKFYILGSDYEFPQKSARVVNRYLSGAGGKNVGEELIAMGTTDFSSVITRIRRAKPDVLFSIMVGTDAVAFAKQFNDYGLKKHIQYASMVDLETYVDAMGKKAAEGNLASFGWFENLDKPRAKAFVEKYHAFEPMRATTLIESCYSVLLLWTKAVKKAGTTEGEAVRKAMAGLSVEAPEGRVTMRAIDNHTARPSYIARVHDGEYRVIKDFGQVQPGEDQRKPKW